MPLPSYRKNTTRIRRASSAPNIKLNQSTMSINGPGNTNVSKTLDQRELLQDFSDDELYDTASSGVCDSKGSRSSTISYILLTAYMIGWSALWTCLLVVVVPYQLDKWWGTNTKAPPLVL